MKTLTKAVKKLSEIDYINMGGCLLAAYAVYLHCVKKAPRKFLPQIVQFGYDFDAKYKDHNLAFLNNEKDSATSDAHFGWTWDAGATVYDAFGMVGRKYDYKLVIPSEATERFCVSSLNYGTWNWCFDRELELPIIADAFDIDLSHIWTTRVGRFFVEGRITPPLTTA